MKYVKFTVFLFLVFTIKVFAQDGIKYISPKKENLRKGPDGDKIGELITGTKVEILERKDKWVKVQCTGWIWEQSLVSDPTSVEGYSVRAAHILLQSEGEAKNVLNRLNQGVSFEELAAQHSIDVASGQKGGDLGWFGKGDFVPDFENSAFRLKIGEVSDVVKTALGYHIIKRLE
jgi:peptidyl-prolyl cis-trans isomerase C